jgi:pimeloyl-ACP methyl ester carboxylesterase
MGGGNCGLAQFPPRFTVTASGRELNGSRDVSYPLPLGSVQSMAIGAGGTPGSSTLDDIFINSTVIEKPGAGRSKFCLEDRKLAPYSYEGMLEQSRLGDLFTIGGVVDLRRGFELRLGDGAGEQFLAAAPDEAPERYASTSPIELLPFRTPQLLIHGTRDEVVPIELADRLGAASSNCKILRLEGGDHFDGIDPRSAY